MRVLKEGMTDDEIIAEIEKLKKSPYMKLARAYNNGALRQKLYTLRSLEKKGKKLAEIFEVE